MPPRDLSAGDRAAAASIRAAGSRLRTRALEAALDLDPTMRERHDELVREALHADLQAFVDLLIVADSSGAPHAMATFADLVVVRYRKRHVSMDDVITLCEGLRRAASSVVDPSATASIDEAIDEAIAVFKWHRRLAGDARKRHPLMKYIYRGA